MSDPLWLTATPPTPNGELHLGHMAGPYVAADTLRRFLLADDVPALMTTGLDDHQSYVALRGDRDGRGAEETADDYGRRVIAGWRGAQVDFDRIVEPRRLPGYGEFVQAFLQKLYDNDVIQPRTRPLPYCDPCDRWLYEAYVTGACPHCGAECNGNACEACGRPNDCGDLGDPRCTLCGCPAGLRDQRRLYLPLAQVADRLAAFWKRVAMPPHVRAMCTRMLADGLPEIAVSHPTNWGVPVPVLGFQDQRIYVWFEMAPGYLLEFDPDSARPTTGPVQFFGFDNSYFHAVLFPALFMLWDDTVPLPAAFVVNEFYRLAGDKFSTSRRHAVWALEGLAADGVDALRYHVLRTRPTGRQTNFDPGDLAAARTHLHEVWNGWLRGLVGAVHAETGGVVPEERPEGADWELLHGRLTRTSAELREAYSVAGFDPRRAIGLLDEVVYCARDYGFTQSHERERPAYRAALTGQLAAAAALAAWAGPALPAGAARLDAVLETAPGRRVNAAALAPPPPGTVLAAAPERIFGE
ncbi:methionine--tRNA ligase [Micromonospora sp. KC606]|uniref:class I tRNA ligase family protein n=1 Tax=Micromonospora sp. KC606 TaxID=2530379 RepID=UPI0010521A0B|nr:class I tRNA ligase family protein [Micromonospora sp. KC606]TDC81660.1 methionine--tRNA ligase [Micromonospora sp. KC606]